MPDNSSIFLTQHQACTEQMRESGTWLTLKTWCASTEEEALFNAANPAGYEYPVWVSAARMRVVEVRRVGQTQTFELPFTKE
jgi:hypothetical protein